MRYVNMKPIIHTDPEALAKQKLAASPYDENGGDYERRAGATPVARAAAMKQRMAAHPAWPAHRRRGGHAPLEAPREETEADRDLMRRAAEGDVTAQRELSRPANAPCPPAPWRQVVGPIPHVPASLPELEKKMAAWRVVRKLTTALEMRDRWPNLTRLYQLRKKWQRRASGEDARYLKYGTVAGRPDTRKPKPGEDEGQNG